MLLLQPLLFLHLATIATPISTFPLHPQIPHKSSHKYLYLLVKTFRTGSVNLSETSCENVHWAWRGALRMAKENLALKQDHASPFRLSNNKSPNFNQQERTPQRSVSQAMRDYFHSVENIISKGLYKKRNRNKVKRQHGRGKGILENFFF